MIKNQSKPQLFQLLSVLILPLFIYFSCKKPTVREGTNEELQNVTVAETTLTSPCDNLVCEDCTFQETIENDTSEYTTILGGTYANPYSIANMTQAYNNIHGTHLTSMSTTHYYVRFKPQTDAQFDILDDSLDLELYDYPLDRVVLQDGDYWPDAYTNLVQGEYPWFYTVVPASFQFPSGITYQNLAPLNIPDDDGLVEDEAFNITGNNECSGVTQSKTKSIQTGSSESSTSKLVQPDFFQDCPVGYYWNNAQGKCLPVPDCGPGYHWNYGLLQCQQDPPPPANLHPQGMINYKTYNDAGVIPAIAPLKFTRIVGRRFFKIDKTYTDANGNFQFSKRFPRKVTIIVKFRTSTVTVRRQPAVSGFWNKWRPMRKNIGTYKGNNLQNLSYSFEKGSDSKKMKTRRWIAAIAINTHNETRNFLSSNGLYQLPNKHRILMIKPVDQHSITAQYEFIKSSGAGDSGGGNDVRLTWITSDINSMTASKVTINVAQQLGIIYLKTITDASNDGISTFNVYNDGTNWADQYWPFGTGVSLGSYNANVKAMWQAFAQHLGHTIATRIYGGSEYSFQLQGKTWSSSAGISGSTKYLEGFDPNIGAPSEPFKWIPVGLINDLMDPNIETVPVLDNVSGFTYSDIQAAYYTEPTTMLAFKNALKNIKPAQGPAIDQLFTSYGY